MQVGAAAQGRRKPGLKIDQAADQDRGRLIARSFWGQRRCAHPESFSDFANRLPRGRTYARRGSIWHLQIHPGRIDAKVHGSRARPYQVTIQVSRLPDATWKAIRNACSGQIGSLPELLRGSLSD